VHKILQNHLQLLLAPGIGAVPRHVRRRHSDRDWIKRSPV
jgi:hypothetical protein